MSIILRRLVTSFSLSLHEVDTEVNTTARKDTESRISWLKDSDRNNLVLHHSEINLEYVVLSSIIAKEFEKDLINLRNAQPERREILKKQLEILLKTATLLEIIYCDYLCEPGEVAQLKKQQDILRHWLNFLNMDAVEDNLDSQTINAVEDNWYTSQRCFKLTICSNFGRLVINRLLRLLRAIALFTNELSFYSCSIKQIDQYAIPIFTHAAWIIFIPRIAVNLTMMLKHATRYYWMSADEKQLNGLTHLRIQWNMRWPDISNDLPWLIANLTSAFVLTGSLAPYAIILSISMQFYEIALALAQWYFETKHLREQLEIYQGLPDSNDKERSIEELEQRLDYDDKRLWIPVWNTSALLVAIILTAPALAATSPFLPLFGGCIAVTTTFASRHKREQLKLSETNRTKNLFSFFQQPTPPPDQPINDSNPKPQ